MKGKVFQSSVVKLFVYAFVMVSCFGTFSSMVFSQSNFILEGTPRYQPLGGITGHQPIVEELVVLLRLRPDLRGALEESLHKAGRLGILTLSDYYEFLDEMVTMVPTQSPRPAISQLNKFYYLIDHSSCLRKDSLFQSWVVEFARDWGSFLDTTESAKGLGTFYTDPSFHIDDYYVGPSGWLTFNQFFARQVRPGKRPVAGLCDDRIVVSPADSVFMGHWPIDEHSEITVKNVMKYSVLELLDSSPYQDRFKGGVFIHSFLNVNDYHRYHVPVGGVVKEIRKISGRAILDVVKKADGSLEVVDGTGYQFTQIRGLIVLDSPVGLVAVLPIGMAQVSSVNLTPEEGATLAKGEEFGYFLFGASDIIVLFEAGEVEITAEIGTHYNQGTKIGHAVKQTCP